ncbi:Pentatricopeptide repeat-containing protein [Acorus gramineus]|uniref:Pentatricopeptide repeat-containing protein n=1 Tax=Acorus gramineus TaxID=55184 RepID=A0AAV9BT33_ACOGR|nr:Pentatricopeptide repeat-containing protein [Acorus gramineus]
MVGEEGVKPDNYTYPLVFKACSALFDLDLARKMYESMHAEEGVKPNIFVDCTLVDMFAKCGSLGEAKSVFERMPQRDIVTWGAMIGGAIECGDSGEALDLFRRMIIDGFRPDSVIIATVLPLCGRFGDLHVGMCLHGWGIKSGIDTAGRWEDSMRVRMMFTGRGLVKKPANSWIQGRRGFHAYIARD